MSDDREREDRRGSLSRVAQNFSFLTPVAVVLLLVAVVVSIVRS